MTQTHWQNTTALSFFVGVATSDLKISAPIWEQTTTQKVKE